ncbi:MAG: hypothetical protein SGILL_002876, partial [Bacillariaceae sp.]
MTTSSESSSATSLVLKMVTQELARDGGAARVTSIKEYVNVSSKKFNALLVQSNVKKRKLLVFLENHPSVFQVERSSASPHWVTLVDQQQANNVTKSNNSSSNNSSSFLKDILDGAEIDAEAQKDLRAQAYDKALLVLRKRQAKTQRRQK